LARPLTIAIDGPVAAGKTTVGRRLSSELRYRFLDTGILYRALTWLALDLGIDLKDEGALGRLAWNTSLRLKDVDDETVIVDGREVSAELRGPDVDRGVSLVARLPEVRSALVEQQREIAREGGIVVVGRDIGTVVLPRADLKLFLVASASQRAKRRQLEMERRGKDSDYAQVMKDLVVRDEIDTGRAHAPLRPADDAVMLDTDDLDEDGVLGKVLELLGEGRWG
jgi:cytidylate kinase